MILLTTVPRMRTNVEQEVIMEQEKNSKKEEILADLRQKIQKLEGFKPESLHNMVKFNIPEIDDAFPGKAFPLGMVHEFACKGQEGTAAAFGFSACIFSEIAKQNGAILWITKSREIYPPGLRMYGINPERVVFVELKKDKEALWAMEEGLRTKGLSVVIGEVSDADLIATRRLQLAVEESGVTGFLMRIDSKYTGSSSCFTSWEVKSIPSHFEDNMPGVGFPRWEIELLKVRNGTPGKWQVEWKSGQFHLVKEQKEEILPPIQHTNNVIRIAG